MEYFVISENPNGNLCARCFSSFTEAADYVKSIAPAKWSLFQWRGSQLFWLKGSSFEDVSDLTRDIFVNEVLHG